MAIFDGLSARGRTIVLVTHERRSPSHANRVVRLRDGLSSPTRPAPTSLARRGRVPVVNVLDDLRSALRGLSANKLRSALTVLGIMIGVAAVIILVAVGNGSSQAVQNRIKALGTNTITISSRGRFGRGPATTGTQTQSATITAQDVATMSDPDQAPDISSVSPVLSTSVTATYGAATTTTSVTGTTPAYLTAEDDTVRGRPGAHRPRT